MMRVCSLGSLTSLGSFGSTIVVLVLFGLEMACGEVLIPRQDDDPASNDPRGSSPSVGEESPSGASSNGGDIPSPPPPPGSPFRPVPGHDRMVFVTSMPLASKDLKGALGADIKCNEIAKASGDPNIFEGREYIAWVADDVSLPPMNRVIERMRPYVRPDGERVANNFVELQVNGPLVPIEVDEKGGTQTGIVWSGTTNQGHRSRTPNCNNWSVNTGVGNIGRIVASIPEWTDDDSLADCYDTRARVYCFER